MDCRTVLAARSVVSGLNDATLLLQDVQPCQVATAHDAEPVRQAGQPRLWQGIDHSLDGAAGVLQ